ncbi:transposase [Bradyrhizobium sp. LM2.7]
MGVKGFVEGLTPAIRFSCSCVPRTRRHAMNVRYRVELSQIECTELRALLSGGKHASRKLKRAQILLAADAGTSDEEIARSVGVSGSTVYRTKRRFVEGNLERALSEEMRPGAERKLTGKEEALLVATACASPPKGRARWTLKLLAGAMVKLTEHKSLSHETVRRRLAENGLKPWRKDMWCIPQVDGEYVARMEDVLDLYAEASDPKRPVVCFDESPVQLIGEVRQPIPARPGQLERYDYEYRRNGTVNLFVLLDVHRPWRKVKVTDRRAAEDYAQCMRDLVDIHYPDAEIIRVVQDNLSTHCAGALYQAFPPAEARRILRRLEFHYTPAGSTWSKSRSASCGASAWIAGSTTPSDCAARSLPGNGNETPPAPASNGCSQQTRPAPKWQAPIPPLPKSHNHCDEILVRRSFRFALFS